MTFWQSVEHSPEWVGVFANVLFAIVTTVIVIWQVCVMRRQGRLQNRLIRLQHEYDWLLRLNSKRQQILKLARSLHLAASRLKQKISDGDEHNWQELQDAADELQKRLAILDSAAYTGPHDQWFSGLTEYVDAIRKGITDDDKFNSTHALPNETPNLRTRTALKDADDRYKPLSICHDLEAAIRLEYFDFKRTWDADSSAKKK